MFVALDPWFATVRKNTALYPADEGSITIPSPHDAATDLDIWRDAYGVGVDIPNLVPSK